MFTFHTDPGHGWLEVDWTHFKGMGLMPRDFSAYSYRKHNTFYLEEDCDATRFIEKYKLKYGRDPEVKVVHTNSSSFIRNLKGIHS